MGVIIALSVTKVKALYRCMESYFVVLNSSKHACAWLIMLTSTQNVNTWNKYITAVYLHVISTRETSHFTVLWWCCIGNTVYQNEPCEHTCCSHVVAGVACNDVNKEEEEEKEKEEEEEEEEVWKQLKTWIVVELESSWVDGVFCVAVITPATDEDMYDVMGCAKSKNMILCS